MKTILTSIAAGLTLLAGLLLGFMAFHYYGKAVNAENQARQLQSHLALQSATIAGQALTFQTFNKLAAASLQHATQTTSASESKTIEYRTILKKEPVCSQLVPAAVSDRLYNYALRLRSGAVSGAVSDADGTRAGTASARTLTYCQAVLWIDPLLSAIDKANDQLSGIRAEDEQRTGIKSPRQSPAS